MQEERAVSDAQFLGATLDCDAALWRNDILTAIYIGLCQALDRTLAELDNLVLLLAHGLSQRGLSSGVTPVDWQVFNDPA